MDAHVRVGASREAQLEPGELLTTMDELGIDRALISPAEPEIAWANRAGNDRVCVLSREHPDRLLAYAVANPWAGSDAVQELQRAREMGAVALAVDPVLQGIDVLDGLIDPLLEFAAEAGWPVYVRCGSPPSALPLAISELAVRHADVPILLGRTGATDFIIDAAPAMRRAPNLYAETSHVSWDTILSLLAKDSEIGIGRIVFATDLPYTIARGELERVQDWPMDDQDRDRVLGGNLSALLD